MPKVPSQNSIRISLQSAPFVDDPEGADIYYAALGRALTLWARFEAQFDCLILLMCMLPETATIRPNPMPVPLRQKLTLFKKFLKNVPLFDGIRSEGLKLVPDILDSASDRHILVHGHWYGFVENDPLTARYLTRRPKVSKIIVDEYKVDVHSLELNCELFESLNLRLFPLTLAAR